VAVDDDRAEEVGGGGRHRVGHRDDDEQQGVVGRLQVEPVGRVVVDLGLVVGKEQAGVGDHELHVGALIEAAEHRERAELVADAHEDEAAHLGKARQAAGEVELRQLLFGLDVGHRRKSTRDGWITRAVAPRAAW
jgi:hypothetical protein